jgi:hypothetical protein
MPEVIHDDYEVSSEGAVRHWEIPYASLSDATPTPTNPAMVNGTAGLQLTGTILTIDAVRSVAILDLTPSMVYQHEVRTVTTYAGAVETVWAAIAIGLPVYYDNSATMPAGCYLSLAAANNLGVANPLFGWVVPADETDTFPKAAGAAGNTWDQAVTQHGA